MTTAQRTRLRDLREQDDIRPLDPLRRAELDRLEGVAREAAHAEALIVNAQRDGRVAVTLRPEQVAALRVYMARAEAADPRDASGTLWELLGFLESAFDHAGAVA